MDLKCKEYSLTVSYILELIMVLELWRMFTNIVILEITMDLEKWEVITVTISYPGKHHVKIE